MRNIQESMLGKEGFQDPRVRKALDDVRTRYNADFKKFQDVYAAQGPEAARSYLPELQNNIYRGFRSAFQFLPIDHKDSELVSSYDLLSNVMSLQIAAILNEGRPSDPDAQRVQDGMGAISNDPAVLFSKQSSMINYLADMSGPDIIATHDPTIIREFNDAYYSVTGADYDPRGQSYRGIQNKTIPSVHKPFDASGVDTGTDDLDYTKNNASFKKGGGSFGGLTAAERKELQELEELERRGMLD
jgi:hypothetical protein